MDRHLAVFYGQSSLSVICLIDLKHAIVRNKVRFVYTVGKLRFFLLFFFFFLFLICVFLICLFHRCFCFFLGICSIAGASTKNCGCCQHDGQYRNCNTFFLHRILLLFHCLCSMIYIDLLDVLDLAKTCDLCIYTVKFSGRFEHA